MSLKAGTPVHVETRARSRVVFRRPTGGPTQNVRADSRTFQTSGSALDRRHIGRLPDGERAIFSRGSPAPSYRGASAACCSWIFHHWPEGPSPTRSMMT